MTDVEILSHQEDASALELSETLTTLQHRLETSIQLASGYKSENATLASQLRDAQNLHSTMSRRYGEWREVWKKELESVAERERNLKREEEVWSSRLKGKRQELKDLELRCLGLQDSGGGGTQTGTMKDIENDLTDKIEKLTLEKDKWRDQFYQTRKINEQLQAMCDEYQSQTEREKDISQSYQKEISSLQQSFAKQLQEYIGGDNGKQSNVHLEDRVRELKHLLDERNLEVEKLHADAKEAKKAEDEVYVAKQELVAVHQADHSKWSRECVQLESMIQVLQRRLAATEKELTEVTKRKDELEEAVDCGCKELRRLQDTLKTNTNDHQAELENLRKVHHHNETKLKLQLSTARNMLADEQSKSKQLVRRVEETQEHALKQIEELAKALDRDDDSKEDYLAARDQIMKLENIVANLRDENKQIILDSQAEIQRLKHACETVHQESNLALLEKSDMERTLQTEKAKSQQIRSELEESERSGIKLEERCRILTDEKVKLMEQLNDFRMEKKSLEEKSKTLFDGMNAAKEEIKTLTNQSAKEREGAKEILESEIAKLKDQLSREKRRSDAYKEKARQAHSRNLKAKDLLESMRTTEE